MSAPSQPWTDVCGLADLEPERGVAALLGATQVAVFRLCDGRLAAVQHLDPVSGAHVLARGIVGTRGRTPTVTSPVYKQVYDLITGECLEGQGAAPPALRRFEVRLDRGRVLIGPEIAPGGPAATGRDDTAGSGRRLVEAAAGS